LEVNNKTTDRELMHRT